MKRVSGGLLLQDNDWETLNRNDIEIVSKDHQRKKNSMIYSLHGMSSNMLNQTLLFLQRIKKLSESEQDK